MLFKSDNFRVGRIQCREERGWMPAQPVPTWRTGLWDIVSCAHILLRSSEFGLSGFMRRLLTGYAICYNHRHHRWGHLFQNRYKSIVCDEDAYFRKLVRYIHLNPLRAKLVKSLAALGRYRWCGHSVLMGRVKEVSARYGFSPVAAAIALTSMSAKNNPSVLPALTRSSPSGPTTQLSPQ